MRCLAKMLAADQSNAPILTNDGSVQEEPFPTRDRQDFSCVCREQANRGLVIVL